FSFRSCSTYGGNEIFEILARLGDVAFLERNGSVTASEKIEIECFDCLVRLDPLRERMLIEIAARAGQRPQRPGNQGAGRKDRGDPVTRASAGKSGANATRSAGMKTTVASFA